MIKWTTFATHTSEGEPLIRVLSEHLEKTAAYRPDLTEFINTFEKKANQTYLLVNAMTSGEAFGPNLNGDYFPEEQLKTYHKTFEKFGYAYRHHVNKDPEKSAGKVIFATYNPTMHRVELVIEMDNTKGADILERLHKGEFPAVSMGTRTPSDRCSICGNRAKNTASYCQHLKFEMRRILPDGRRVYAVNDDKLTFFDISFVRIPADRTASVLSKLAHVEDEQAVTPSASIGEEWLKRAGIKESTLFKEVPGSIEGMSEDPKGLILASRKPLPKDELGKLANEHSLKDILSTFLATRIVPTPDEFQHIVLVQMKRPDLIDKAEEALKHKQLLLDLGEDPMIPVDVSMSGFNTEVLQKISHWIEGSALTKPLIIKRALLKRAEDLGVQPQPMTKSFGPMMMPQTTPVTRPNKNPFWALAGLGALYLGYVKLFNHPPDSMEALLKTNKHYQFLIPSLLGATAVATNAVQSNLFEKQAAFEHFLPRALVTVPATYTYAGHIENKVQKGEPVTEFQNMVRKHPFMASMGAYVASGSAAKNIKKFTEAIKKYGSYDRLFLGLSPEKFDELYKDVIGINPLDNK